MSISKHGDALLSAEDNRRMFEDIAGRYDRLNRMMSLGFDRLWRRHAVNALRLCPGAAVLDAGCGTGDLCVDILKSVPDCRTVGLDPSLRMLELAKEKLRLAGLSARAEFLPGDITALSFDDAVFDGVISGFCIRNVCNRLAAFKELRRVLKPGGRIVLLELTRPHHPIVRAGHCLFLHGVVPILGALFSKGRAYRYLAESIEQFVEPGKLAGEMRAAGLADVQTRSLTGGVVTLLVATA